MQGQHPACLVAKHVLTECCRQHRQPLVNGRQPRLAGLIKVGPFLDEPLVVQLKDPPLLRRKVKLVAPFMQVTEMR
jgi:hypothetical protein